MVIGTTPQSENFPIKYFQKILTISEPVGLSPPFDFSRKCFIRQRAYFFKIGIICMLHITFLYRLILHTLEVLSADTHVLLFTLNIFLGTIGEIEFVVGAFIRRLTWEDFYNEIINYSKLLEKRQQEDHLYRLMYFYFGVILSFIMVILLTFFIADTQFEIKDLFPLNEFVAQFYNLTHRFIVCTFLYFIKNEFNSLSTSVTTLILTENKSIYIKNIEVRALKLENIKCIANQLFSVQFFIMSMVAFFCTLEYCLLLNYNDPMNWLYLIYVIPIFVCIYVCDVTYKAAQKLTANVLAVSTTFKDDPEIYEKLKDLSFKLQMLQKGFTAARFINVDRKVAVSLLSAVGTYFFVIQQMYIPRRNY